MEYLPNPFGTGTNDIRPRLMSCVLLVHAEVTASGHQFRQNRIIMPILETREIGLRDPTHKKHPIQVTRTMVPHTLGLLKDADIDGLKDFAESIWTLVYKDIISPGQIRYMLDRLYDAGLLREHISAGNPLFGAYRGDKLVGYAHVFIEGQKSRLDKLYVDSLHQQMGIGRALVDEAVEFALHSGCSLMTLRVNRNNTNAVQAYEKYGFGIVATHQKDIGGGYIMDDYLMLKNLVTDHGLDLQPSP